ncbi:MAG: hypothetical protein ACP5JJ_16720 [Anaerolineae bacterium]
MSGESPHPQTRGSAIGALIATIVVLFAAIALAGGLASPGPPQLVVGESVAADFESLARETWGRFLAVFWARRACFGDVRLEAVYGLGSRAGYDPDLALATVRVPGTVAMLQSGLVHEWAHHVEFQCPAHEVLRPAFLAAQDLPPDTPWRPAGATTDIAAAEWASIPSEQYAEAVVDLVLGGRSIPTRAHVTRVAVRVVAAWAAGRPPQAALEAGGE